MDTQSVKIVVAGGFGAGKTTLVASVSEITPLTTEEALTQASVGVDDVDGVEEKRSTTVAFDFGRITIDSELVLYLFGTPGQDRFWFMWDELSYGAMGAIVLVDTRRLKGSFPAIDYFESRDIPFVIAVNEFDGEHLYEPEEIRSALKLVDTIPVVFCDARKTDRSKQALIELVKYVIRQPTAAARAF